MKFLKRLLILYCILQEMALHEKAAPGVPYPNSALLRWFK